MKHIYIIILSLLALAACTKTHAPETPQTSTITYQLSADIQMEIKSTPETAVNVLWYGVYIKQANGYVYMPDLSAFVDITNPMSMTVPVTLISGQEYKIAFVAQYKNVEDETYTYQVDYDNFLLKLNNSTNLAAIGEKLDVYTNYDIVNTADQVNNKPITLTRPVAQINIATSSSDIPSNMNISLTNVAQAYNLFEKTYTYSPSDNTVAFTGTPLGGTLELQETQYNKLATFYVFGTENQKLSCEMNLQYTSTPAKEVRVSDITVAPNHKTNIVGNI